LALLSLFSVSAFADDFACTMTVGYFNRAKETAPYRGREITVKLGTFVCTGTIDNDIMVKTTITSTETGEEASMSSRGFSETKLTALNQWGDGQDHAVCKCGLE
jgi:hypothetical protein